MSGASTAKDELYRLVDQLSADERDRAKEVLEALVEKREDRVLLRFASAPTDDEPLTTDEEVALEEGLDDVRAGRVVAWAEVRDKYLHPKS